MIIKKLMKKVALIGEVHEEGLKILKDNNFALILFPEAAPPSIAIIIYLSLYQKAC